MAIQIKSSLDHLVLASGGENSPCSEAMRSRKVISSQQSIENF